MREAGRPRWHSTRPSRAGTAARAGQHTIVLGMNTPRSGDRFPPVPTLLAVPTSSRALATEARRIHSESVRYWSAYPLESFFRRPAPDVWAPADQVRHLTKSIRAVTQGLRLPRVALLVLFGRSRRSRSFEALVTDYKAALAGGGRAGRFAPSAVDATEQNETGRARIMAYHAAAIDAFASALERWSDRALDRYRLPHPLLGSLTVREMAQFTLLHNVHHVNVAERRRSTDA
jgi:hypothetical protein